jgi:2-polyprenyl-3-methyl-5-hydroxy-6-metoxy-1,4-benzoquinol methylase
MNPHWNVSEDSFELSSMPFYWRMKDSMAEHPCLPSRIPIRLTIDAQHDYLRYLPTETEQEALNTAYKQNENIGFINAESGQLHTYGSSVNRFILSTIGRYRPKRAYEIGCGAGFTIQYLKANGWDVTGIDPSSYSEYWSRRLGFQLINEFFNEALFDADADFIYCNDVFEHISNVDQFSRSVHRSLRPGGTFCFATTNSTESIRLGDISMLEHQHVNMFTRNSLLSILATAGFGNIIIDRGSYGNTFHVTAQKDADTAPDRLGGPVCPGYFVRAREKIFGFRSLYESASLLLCYVPLRSFPYLSTIGDFGTSAISDSNASWHGKYIDGYDQPIRNIDEIEDLSSRTVFIGSLTFGEEIRQMLVGKNLAKDKIFSITDL